MARERPMREWLIRKLGGVDAEAAEKRVAAQRVQAEKQLADMRGIAKQLADALTEKASVIRDLKALLNSIHRSSSPETLLDPAVVYQEMGKGGDDA